MTIKNILLGYFYNIVNTISVMIFLLLIFFGGICGYLILNNELVSIPAIVSIYEIIRNLFIIPNQPFITMLITLSIGLSLNKKPYIPKDKNIDEKVEGNKNGNSETDNVVTVKHYIPE